MAVSTNTGLYVESARIVVRHWFKRDPGRGESNFCEAIGTRPDSAAATRDFHHVRQVHRRPNKYSLCAVRGSGPGVGRRARIPDGQWRAATDVPVSRSLIKDDSFGFVRPARAWH